VNVTLIVSPDKAGVNGASPKPHRPRDEGVKGKSESDPVAGSVLSLAKKSRRPGEGGGGEGVTQREENGELNNLQERGELSPAPLHGGNEVEPLNVSLRSLGGKRSCLRGDSNITAGG